MSSLIKILIIKGKIPCSLLKFISYLSILMVIRAIRYLINNRIHSNSSRIRLNKVIKTSC